MVSFSLSLTSLGRRSTDREGRGSTDEEIPRSGAGVGDTRLHTQDLLVSLHQLRRVVENLP